MADAAGQLICGRRGVAARPSNRAAPSRRLVVLDLDLTVWAFYADHAATAAAAGGGGGFRSLGDPDVLVVDGGRTEWRLCGEARRVIEHLAARPEQYVVRIASASAAGATARALLRAYGFSALVRGAQIYPGNKGARHLAEIARETGLPLSEAVFFDDVPSFCRQVEAAGATAVRVDRDRGVTMADLTRGLARAISTAKSARFLQQFVRPSSVPKATSKHKSTPSSTAAARATVFSAAFASSSSSSSSSSRFTECPVCQKSILISRADAHVLKCLEATEPESPPEKKASLFVAPSAAAAMPIRSSSAMPSRDMPSSAVLPPSAVLPSAMPSSIIPADANPPPSSSAAAPHSPTTTITTTPNLFHALIHNQKKLSAGRSFRHHEKLPGVHIFENFVSLEQEAALLAHIERADPNWQVSRWNGLHLNKEWGQKIIFDRSGARPIGMLDASSTPLPAFLREVAASFTSGAYLPTAAFRPNHCNAIRYVPAEGHYLGPHFDDRRLSGELLANISLMADATMVYEHGTTGERVDVLLKRGSLQVVTGKARYDWKHAIPRENFAGASRVSLTFRRQGGGGAQMSRGKKRRRRTMRKYSAVQ